MSVRPRSAAAHADARPSRLVVLDVDGTLVDPGAVLDDGRVEALAALRADGTAISLATGKIWHSIDDVTARLELPGPHACCNGAAIVVDGAPIEFVAMDPAVAEEVATGLADAGVPFAWYLADGDIVTTHLDPAFTRVTDLGEAAPRVAEVDGRPILKVLSVVENDAEGDLRRLAAGRASIQRTGQYFLEWQSPGVDKGTAVERIASRLGLGWDAVVAVGDAENDVPMLLRAGLGVAVGSAAPVAVAAADRHLAEVDLTDFLRSLVA